MYKILEAQGLDEAHPEEGFHSIQRAIDILGSKWSFLVLARLSCRPQRFNQLRREFPKMSTKSLTDTLRHLERHTMIQRRVFPTMPVTVEYSLTTKGEAYQAVLVEMYKWGHTWNGQSNESEAKNLPPHTGDYQIPAIDKKSLYHV